MTVKELIEVLQDADQDRLVVMSGDGEGNTYSPLNGLYLGSYISENDCFGRVGLEELTPDLAEQGFSEEDVLDGEKALVLCPSS